MQANAATQTHHARAAAPPTWIRGAVREVLDQTPGYQALGKDERQSLAHAMVRVSALAARLIEEEGDIHVANGAPLARAQSQPDFGAAADRIAQTTQNILNAVSFPRFVTDLINGVFRAMLDSNQAQMQQYVNLLNAVSASAEGFEGGQFGLVRVRQWVADQFPESIEYEAPEIEPGEEPDPDEIANTRLRLRSGSSMPPLEVVRAMLGITPEEPLEASNPEHLVPLARRHLARQRQQMLATMVMMGMQRIVIDSGKINAAMRFHIDTRSAANQDQGSRTSVQNRVKAGGSFGVGPWGASAEIENTIGYVSTQRTQSTEEMNTDLELNSSVELNFRSDYLPLNQMTNQAQAERIRNSTINPVATVVEDPATAQAARLAAQRAAEDARRTATRDSMTLPVAAVAPVSAAPARTAPPTPPRPTAPAVTPATTPAIGTAPTTTSPAAPVAAAPSTAAPAVTAAPEAPTTTSTTAPAVPPAATPPATGSTAAGSSTTGHTVGTHIGAAVGTAAGGVVGGAIGTAVGGPIGTAIGGPIGTAIGGPIGTAVGGAVGTEVGGLVGGMIDAGINSGPGTTPTAH